MLLFPLRESITPGRHSATHLRVVAAVIAVPLVVAALTGFGTVPAAVAAAPSGSAVDQSDETDSGFDFWEIPGSGIQFAQTFTAGKSGLLTAVDVRLLFALDAGTDGVTNVQIMGTNASGQPNGTTLASGSVPVGFVGLATVALSAPVPVISGDQYAIVLSSDNHIEPVVYTAATYAAGTFYQGFGGTWRAPGGYSLYFATYVDRSANSAPALSGTPDSTIIEGRSYSYGYSVDGSPAPDVTVGSGTLPTGLQLSRTGVLSGTPTADGTYNFSVSADNGVDSSASVNSTITVRDAKAPGAPTIGTATADSGQATVSFTAPDDPGDGTITSYEVISSPGGFVAVGTRSPITLPGLTNGTAYTFTVKAVSNVGVGAPSAPSNSVTPETVPAVPTGVTATPQSQAVQLAWTAPDNGGAAIESYSIQESTDGFSWHGVDSPTGTLDTITGLANGTTYYFRVAAVNSVGTGDWSGSAHTTPRTTPGAPTDVRGAGADGAVVLSWIAPSDNGGATVQEYSIQYSDDGTRWNDGGSPSTSPTTVSGLTNGTHYQFRVAAMNPAGVGPWSSPVTATPFGIPDAPAGLDAVPDNSEVDLSWNAPFDGGSDLTGYDLQYRASGGANWIDGGSWVNNSANVTGLENGTTYEFQVRAKNAAGSGGWSASASMVPRTVPDAPIHLTTAPHDGAVDLSWTAPGADGGSDVTGFEAEYRVDGGTWSDPALAADASTVFAALANGTEYEFRVAAVNAAGTGAWSDSVFASPRTVPDAPTLTSALGSDGEATLAWTPPADGGASIGGYDIQYRTTGTSVWADGPIGVSSPANVSALTNGTSYDFRVRAVNAAGPGAWGDALSAVPFVFAVSFEDARGYSIAGDTLSSGDSVLVSGGDLPPGATVTIDLHSIPVTLGTATVAPDGTLSLRAVIPAGTAAGSHSLVATITGAGVTTTTASVAFMVASAPLASTGDTIPWLPLGLSLIVLIGVGTTLVTMGRRRDAYQRRKLA